MGKERGDLLGASVLGDSLGTLGDSVLGKLSGEEEPDSGLDLPRGDGGPLVVVCKTAGLSSNTLKQVVDKRVHDAHGLGGDTGVRVHLLQDLVDVDGIRLLPLLVLLLLIALGDSLGGLAGLGSSFSRGLGRHGDWLDSTEELAGRQLPASLLYKFEPSLPVVPAVPPEPESQRGVAMPSAPSFSPATARTRPDTARGISKPAARECVS